MGLKIISKWTQINSNTINTTYEAFTEFQDTAGNNYIHYSVVSDQSQNGYTLCPISPSTCIVEQVSVNEVSEFYNDANEVSEFYNDDQLLGGLTVRSLSYSTDIEVEANFDKTSKDISDQSLNRSTAEPIHNMSTEIKSKKKPIEIREYNDEDTAKENWYRNNKKRN